MLSIALETVLVTVFASAFRREPSIHAGSTVPEIIEWNNSCERGQRKTAIAAVFFIDNMKIVIEIYNIFIK